MPITFTKAYVANGKTFATIQEAQRAELEALFSVDGPTLTWTPTEISSSIIGNADKIMDILTTTDSSRPLARKSNGGRKPRKNKADAAPTTTEPTPAV